MGRGERVSLHQPPERVHSPGGERRPSLRIPEPLECTQVVMPVSPDAKIDAAGARIGKAGHVHCRLSMNAVPGERLRHAYHDSDNQSWDHHGVIFMESSSGSGLDM